MAQPPFVEEHRDPAELLKAYQEARAGLDAGSAQPFLLQRSRPEKARPAELMALLVRGFRQGTSVSRVMREFLARATPADHSPGEIQQSRALLTDNSVTAASLQGLKSGLPSWSPR